MENFSAVGRRVPRIDGIPIVTGETRYAADIYLPGMLHGKVLRSKFPHARILHIDTRPAERLPGVKAVITAEDTPKRPYTIMSLAFADKLPLASGKVRYLGDEVAAVAAVDEEIAQEALDLIRVDYEELPAVFDPLAALRPGAPLVHEGKRRNVAVHPRWEIGQVETGWAEADHFFEETFATQPVSHCCLETHGSVAAFDRQDRLTVWTSTQSPYYVKWDLAYVLQMPIEKVRVMKVQVGGGFGSKSRITETAALSAFLSRKSRRPVRVVYTREENFLATRSRHPMFIHLKTGVKKDGTIVALEGRTVVEDGAYNDVGQAVAALSGLGLMFKIPHIREEGLAVYTNNHYGGRFRAFHGPAMMFALDSHLDTIARRLHMDPVELRLKNAVETGDPAYLRQKGLSSCGLKECLRRAAGAAGWRERKDRGPNRGMGISVLIHPSSGLVGEVSSAFVKISDDRVTVISGATEIGGGQETLVAQMAAEELGVPVEEVKVVSMDTDATPLDLGSRASRFTFYGGNAVRLAAADAKRKLLERGAEKLEARPEDLEIREGKIYVKGSPQRFIHYTEAASELGAGTGGGLARVGKAVLGQGHYDRLTGREACAFAAQIAEVEVEPETGQVKILKFIAAHDLGRAINPLFAEGQVEGGICQGIGYTLTEEVIREKGEIMNPNFRDYKLPTAMDVPPIETILVESIDPHGPFGAKAAGEPTSNPTPGAIANAIYDAVGVRIKSLPITPEKVLRALREKEKARSAEYAEPDRPLSEWWPADLEGSQERVSYSEIMGQKG